MKEKMIFNDVKVDDTKNCMLPKNRNVYQFGVVYDKSMNCMVCLMAYSVYWDFWFTYYYN